MSDHISKRSATERLIIAKTLLESVLQDMPTAEPRKGKWIEAELDSTFLVCSVCKSDKVKLARAWRKEYAEIYRYCPNCGARMEESE